MMALIDTPTVGRAYAFGWSKLGALLAEYWWIYAVAVVVDAACSTWSATASGLSTGTIASIVATFPAVATTARLVRTDACLHARDVAAIVAMWLLMLLALAIVVALVVLVARLSSGLGVFAGLGAFVLLIWLTIRCMYVQIVYANARTRHIGEAFAKSFDLADGARWWSTLGLALAIVATLLIPTIVFSAMGWSALSVLREGGSRLPIFPLALAIDVCSVVSIVWSNAAFTALASSFGALEGDATPAVT